MQPVIDQFVALARQEVGARQGPVHHTGARIEDYQGATWLQPGAWPWSAAFACWLLRELLDDEAAREYLRGYLNRPTLGMAQAEKLRCRDATAVGWETWARGNGILMLGPDSLARAGDVVVFAMPHIGLVVDDQGSLEQPVHTIEGNTLGRSEQDGDSGDGVWEHERAPQLVRSYIRIFR